MLENESFPVQEETTEGSGGIGIPSSCKTTAIPQPVYDIYMPASDSPPENSKHHPASLATGWKIDKISGAIKLVLETLGEDPSREGLQKSPERFAKAMVFLTKGYELDPTAVLKDAIFHEDHQGLILVKDIEFSSLCEHHLIPFIGKIHIGYIPNGKIVGLSKTARVAEAFARRLQVQERLTTQVAHCLFDVLQPRGVGVVVEATHQCMAMRGVQKVGASTTTTCFLGDFVTDRDFKEDFWRTLHG